MCGAYSKVYPDFFLLSIGSSAEDSDLFEVDAAPSLKIVFWPILA